MSISRRDFLKVSGATTAAGSWLAATLPSVAADAPARASNVLQEAEVVWMMNSNEFSDEEIALFQEKNPGITLTRVDNDQTALFAMMAAGDPPDSWRLQYPQFPQLLARDLVLNLQSFFEGSAVIADDDLVSPNNFYKATDPFNIGEGDRYGMIKDWSPDMTMFVNDALFEAAGVDPVSSAEPLSYQAWADLGRAVKKFDGDRAEVVGMFMNTAGWADRYWEAWLQPLGSSLYSEDFTTINIVNNEEARAMIQYHLDLMADLTITSPKLTLAAWACPDMVAGTLAIVQFGYWFSACLRTSVGDMADFQALMDEGKIRMVPAPTWGDMRSSPTITATANVVSSTTADPDATWKAFQYYMAEEPAITRAEIGWGVPALQSLFDLLPKDDLYGQQNFDVLTAEQEFATTIIGANPYLVGGEPDVVGQVFNQNLEQYLDGAISFDDLLFFMEEEGNFSISEGQDRIG
jgi:multiple sugar transport system substrate-binding protein